MKYFKCSKCNNTYAGNKEKNNMQCGSFIGFAFKQDQEDPVPVGCGGTMIETSLEEIEREIYQRRG